MKDLIRQIRSHLNMSQAEFAECLNVNFATVNRWENGRAMPNKLAQSRLFDLCLEKSVPLYSLVLEKIAVAAKQIQANTGRLCLYHGSKSGIVGRIEPISRRQCDFGRGFYMGTDPAQALTLICDYEDSKFYVVSIQLADLIALEVPADLDWAMLVAYHRGRMESVRQTALYRKYQAMSADKDLLIGSIANDRMFYVIDNFFVGNITDAALVGSLSALQLGKQYVAVTQKACDAVNIEAEIPLSYLEKAAIRCAAEENRAKGISLANQICKDHRREGKFFDELLEEAMR